MIKTVAKLAIKMETKVGLNQPHNFTVLNNLLKLVRSIPK